MCQVAIPVDVWQNIALWTVPYCPYIREDVRRASDHRYDNYEGPDHSTQGHPGYLGPQGGVLGLSPAESVNKAVASVLDT